MAKDFGIGMDCTLIDDVPVPGELYDDYEILKDRFIFIGKTEGEYGTKFVTYKLYYKDIVKVSLYKGTDVLDPNWKLSFETNSGNTVIFAIDYTSKNLAKAAYECFSLRIQE